MLSSLISITSIFPFHTKCTQHNFEMNGLIDEDWRFQVFEFSFPSFRVFVFLCFRVFGRFQVFKEFWSFQAKIQLSLKGPAKLCPKIKKKKTPSGEQQYCVEKFPMQPVECSDFERLPIRMTFSLFLVALEKSRNKKIPRDKVAVFFSRT